MAHIQFYTAAALGSPAGGAAAKWAVLLEWPATQAEKIQKNTNADFTGVSCPIEAQHSLSKLTKDAIDWKEKRCSIFGPNMSTYTPMQTCTPAHSHTCVGKIVKQPVFMWELVYVSLHQLLWKICSYARVTSQPVDVIINTTQQNVVWLFFSPTGASLLSAWLLPLSYCTNHVNVSRCTHFTAECSKKLPCSYSANLNIPLCSTITLCTLWCHRGLFLQAGLFISTSRAQVLWTVITGTQPQEGNRSLRHSQSRHGSQQCFATRCNIFSIYVSLIDSSTTAVSLLATTFCNVITAKTWQSQSSRQAVRGEAGQPSTDSAAMSCPV